MRMVACCPCVGSVMTDAFSAPLYIVFCVYEYAPSYILTYEYACTQGFLFMIMCVRNCHRYYYYSSSITDESFGQKGKKRTKKDVRYVHKTEEK